MRARARACLSATPAFAHPFRSLRVSASRLAAENEELRARVVALASEAAAAAAAASAARARLADVADERAAERDDGERALFRLPVPAVVALLTALPPADRRALAATSRAVCGRLEALAAGARTAAAAAARRASDGSSLAHAGSVADEAAGGAPPAPAPAPAPAPRSLVRAASMRAPPPPQHGGGGSGGMPADTALLAAAGFHQQLAASGSRYGLRFGESAAADAGGGSPRGSSGGVTGLDDVDGSPAPTAATAAPPAAPASGARKSRRAGLFGSVFGGGGGGSSAKEDGGAGAGAAASPPPRGAGGGGGGSATPGGGTGKLDYADAYALLGKVKQAEAAVASWRLQVQDLVEKLHTVETVRDFLRKRLDDAEATARDAVSAHEAARAQQTIDAETLSFLDEKLQEAQAAGEAAAAAAERERRRAADAEAAAAAREADVARLSAELAELRARAPAPPAPPSAGDSAPAAADGERAAQQPHPVDAAVAAAAGLPADLAALPHGDLVHALRRMAAAHESEVATLRKEKATLVAAVKAARARDAATSAAAARA
jgi:hypothetical protein